MLNAYLPQILIFSGLVLSFLGGLVAFKRQEISKKTQVGLVQENKELAKRNLDLSQLINKNLIGGDSYGSVHPLVIMDNNDQMYILYFENMGEFPLYDVNVEMWNPDDFKDSERSDWRATLDDFKNRRHFEIGNIPPHGGKSLGQPFKLANGDRVKLNLSIVAKNGLFSELLRIVKIDGAISVAQKVNTVSQKEGIGPETLLNKASEKFPRDKNGEIQWE
jgi:hypothetical protein